MGEKIVRMRRISVGRLKKVAESPKHSNADCLADCLAGSSTTEAKPVSLCKCICPMFPTDILSRELTLISTWMSLLQSIDAAAGESRE